MSGIFYSRTFCRPSRLYLHNRQFAQEQNMRIQKDLADMKLEINGSKHIEIEKRFPEAISKGCR